MKYLLTFLMLLPMASWAQKEDDVLCVEAKNFKWRSGEGITVNRTDGIGFCYNGKWFSWTTGIGKEDISLPLISLGETYSDKGYLQENYISGQNGYHDRGEYEVTIIHSNPAKVIYYRPFFDDEFSFFTKDIKPKRVDTAAFNRRLDSTQRAEALAYRQLRYEDSLERAEEKRVADSVKIAKATADRIDDSLRRIKFPAKSNIDIGEYISDNMEFTADEILTRNLGNADLLFSINSDGSVSDVRIKSAPQNIGRATTDFYRRFNTMAKDMPAWEPEHDAAGNRFGSRIDVQGVAIIAKPNKKSTKNINPLNNNRVKSEIRSIFK